MGVGLCHTGQLRAGVGLKRRVSPRGTVPRTPPALRGRPQGAARAASPDLGCLVNGAAEPPGSSSSPRRRPLLFELWEAEGSQAAGVRS